MIYLLTLKKKKKSTNLWLYLGNNIFQLRMILPPLCFSRSACDDRDQTLVGKDKLRVVFLISSPPPPRAMLRVFVVAVHVNNHYEHIYMHIFEGDNNINTFPGCVTIKTIAGVSIKSHNLTVSNISDTLRQA